MFTVEIKQTDRREAENLISYKFRATISQDGQVAEEADFFGAEVKTDAVRMLTGKGLRIAYEAGSTVSATASIQVENGDLLTAFASLNDCRVISKKSPMEGECEPIA